MLIAKTIKYTLNFISPGGTSRGVLHHRPSWFIKIYEKNSPNISGIGECGPIKGLSRDPLENMDFKINELINNINSINKINLDDFPSIKFGLETALLDLKNKGVRKIFDNDFSNGKKEIRINGLIWMGNGEYMIQQIKNKLNDGFQCIKLKIGSINFDEEISIIKNLRKKYSKNELEIRVDANGAFHPENSLKKLDELSKYNLHSIEQPIAINQHEELAKLCENTPIPIALI